MKTYRIALFLYILINSLFILKYGLRIFPWYVVIAACVVYGIIVVVICKYILPKFSNFSDFNIRRGITFVALLVCLLFLTAFQYIPDPMTIKVDRWSAIHNFLFNLTHGTYPYAAQTHLDGYGSPFPVWQLFHLPFYLMGNVGLSFIAGILLFVHSLSLHLKNKGEHVAFALLGCSPAFIYEVFVRSDLMTNFMVSMSILLYCIHYRFTIQKNPLLFGIIVGLMMSTRFSAIIPFCIYYFYDLYHAQLRQQFTFLSVVVITFCITFLPFLLWDSQMLLFFEYNPFILQTRQGHPLDLLILIPIGIALSFWQHQQAYRHFFATAIMLLLLVTVTFVHTMFVNNSWTELFDSTFDITYFGMALPFLCATLSQLSCSQRC